MAMRDYGPFKLIDRERARQLIADRGQRRLLTVYVPDDEDAVGLFARCGFEDANVAVYFRSAAQMPISLSARMVWFSDGQPRGDEEGRPGR